MKRRQFIIGSSAAAVTTVAGATLTGCATATLQKGEILHTVIFDLKHPVGTPAAEQFLTDGYQILTQVPGVHDFQVFRQCSPKNDYQYGFFMRFANAADFASYTAHPDHARFVSQRWDAEVSRFQESDFQKK